MTADRELAREVRAWLREDGHEDADRVLFTVLDQLDRTPQRHAGWLARRFPFMSSNSLRFGIAAVAVVLLALAGWRYLPLSNIGGMPQPTASPTPSPAPTPIPALGDQQDLPAGTYQGVLPHDPPLGFTISVPDGWDAGGDRTLSAPDSDPPAPVHAILLWDVDNLYADPLNPDTGGIDPPVGPSVDDLVDALASHDGWTTTTPTDVTVGGYGGKLLELTVPQAADFLGCDRFGSSSRPFVIWSEPGTGNSWRCMQGPGQTDYVYVLDVEGRRVVITLIGYPDWSGTHLDTLRAMVDSIQFFEP